MRNIQLFQLVLVLMVVMLALGVNAQSGSDNPADYSGNIAIAGSSTVGPVTERMIELFRQAGFRSEITNDIIGSGAGFDRFCEEGITDISNASRAIREDEIEACRALGREPVEFQVGIDALAVTISSANGFVDNLTTEDLQRIFGGQAATWQDVNAQWPQEPIYLFVPGTDSGTFDYFVEEVYDGEELPMLTAPGIAFSESDVVLVQNIENNPYATGFFGYAYYFTERQRLRALSIDGVEPSETSAQSGTYPLARPLFVYTAPSILREKPQVGAFLEYYLSNVESQLGTNSDQIGYFSVSEAQKQENLEKLRAAMAQ